MTDPIDQTASRATRRLARSRAEQRYASAVGLSMALGAIVGAFATRLSPSFGAVFGGFAGLVLALPVAELLIRTTLRHTAPLVAIVTIAVSSVLAHSWNPFPQLAINAIMFPGSSSGQLSVLTYAGSVLSGWAACVGFLSVGLVPSAGIAFLFLPRRPIPPAWLCLQCGYDRRGLRAEAPCPECGHQPALPTADHP